MSAVLIEAGWIAQIAPIDSKRIFTPTSCSWLNAVEGFLSKLTRQALQRIAFRSVDDLVASIDRYIAHTNGDPRPFRWTASTTSIMAKLRVNQPNESEH